VSFDFPASPTDGQEYAPAGGPIYVWRAASGVWEIKVSGSESAFVAKSGDTMTGLLTLSGAPTSALHAATKQYADSKLSTFTPEQYGAVGNGTADDTIALLNTATAVRAAGGGIIVFKGGATYKCVPSQFGAGGFLFDLTNCRGVFVFGQGARILTTDVAGFFNIFYLNNVQDFTINNIKLESQRAVLSSVDGNTWFRCRNETKRVHIEGVEMYYGQAGLLCTSTLDAGTARVEQITAVNCYVFGCYYPFNFQGGGDQFFARGLRTRNCGRCYFPWNVRDHDVEITSEPGGPFSDCNLGTFGTTRLPYLQNIRVVYRSPGRYPGSGEGAAGSSYVSIGFSQGDPVSAGFETGGTIQNIDILMSIAQASPTDRMDKAITIQKLNSSFEFDNVARGHRLLGVKLHGNVEFAGNLKDCLATLFTTSNWTGEFIQDFVVGGLVAGGGDPRHLYIDGRGFYSSLQSCLLRGVTMDGDLVATNVALKGFTHEQCRFNNLSSIIKSGRTSGEPAVYYVTDYAVGDGINIATGTVSISSGSNALTVSAGIFTAADIGKCISVKGAGASGGYLLTTISGFTSTTQVTLAANAATGLGAAAANVTYGTDATAGLKALAAVVNLRSFRIEFPRAKRFIIWPTDASATSMPLEVLFDLNQCRGCEVNFNGSILHALYTLSTAQPFVFTWRQCNQVIINDYYCISDRGRPANPVGPEQGLMHVYFNQSTQIELRRFKAIGGMSGLMCSRSEGSSTPRVSQVYVDMDMTDVFYGVNGQFDIDNLSGTIKTRNAGRSAFGYNNHDWNITVDSTDPISNGDVDIGCYASELPLEENYTGPYKLRYINRYSTVSPGGPTNCFVMIAFTQGGANSTPKAGRIQADIDLDIVSNNAIRNGVLMVSHTLPSQAIGDAGHKAHVNVTGRAAGPWADLLRLGTSADGWGSAANTHVALRDFNVQNGSGLISLGTSVNQRYHLENIYAPSCNLSPSFLVASTTYGANVRTANVVIVDTRQLVSGLLANTSSVDFINVGVDAPQYKEFEFVLEGVVPVSNNNDLLVRFSTDNGTTWSSTGHFHVRNVTTFDGSSAVNAPGGGNNQATATILPNVNNTSGINGKVKLLMGSMPSLIWQVGGFLTGADRYAVSNGYCRIVGSPNAIRFVFSGGAMSSGIIRCYGVI
jgi:hypothetical protein